MPAGQFPNYTEISSRVSLRAWHTLRATGVLLTGVEIALLLLDAGLGLRVMWGVAIPLLPIVFFLAPGVWRNICPLAAMNQTPRGFGFSRALTAPPWLKRYGYVIAITGFVVFVSLRKVIFNHSGPASAALLVGALGGAFAGGVLLKGKSGWCSAICPLLPVQRLYGQTPAILVGNSHCRPCVGCTKNCYDFNPRVAYLTDLHDADREFAGFRLFFAAGFPGLVLAYFEVPDANAVGAAAMYGRLGLYVGASVAVFYALRTFAPVSDHKLTTVSAAVALNIFYWFGASTVVQAVTDHPPPAPLTWGLRGGLLLLTLTWVVRTYRKENAFVAATTSTPTDLHAASRVLSRSLSRSMSMHSIRRMADPEVTFLPEGDRVVATKGATLLEVAEASGKRLEAGCRMGVCGADPVAVKEGAQHLSVTSDDERTTLERLGLAENTRMACCARVEGPVAIALAPERPARPTSSRIADFSYDKAVKRVLVIGNGIAGVTAADHVRRRHPLCQIDLVAAETHNLYNRMGISRLVYGRSAMQGLYLLPESWYDENVVTTWLNTRATAIHCDRREVELGAGDPLPYDRLILATGSSGAVPPIAGFGSAGCFVMRSADDALAMRAFTQSHICRSAVVLGGGLLGLEAADALRRLGLRTTLLARDRLLPRQLDLRASELLARYCAGMGLELELGVEIDRLIGDSRIREVRLADRRALPADIFVVCTGIAPNVELAAAAGLEVDRAVVVDDRMRTSDPLVFAAGDAAQHDGRIVGLWPTAVDQARVAAINAVGGEATFEPRSPTTLLKVVGIELASIGVIDAGPGDETITHEDAGGERYASLIVAGERLAGAILLGYSTEVALVSTAVRRGYDVTPVLDNLRAADLAALARLSTEPLVPAAPAHPQSN